MTSHNDLGNRFKKAHERVKVLRKDSGQYHQIAPIGLAGHQVNEVAVGSARTATAGSVDAVQFFESRRQIAAAPASKKKSPSGPTKPSGPSSNG